MKNKVHYVRDQTMGEDACRVRTRSAPIVLSTLWNQALNVLQAAGDKNRAAQMRSFSADPVEAIAQLQRKITGI